MKKLKRYISLLLAVLIISSMIPVEAFATETAVTDASGSSAYCDWTYTASTNTLYVNTDGILDGSEINSLPTYYTDGGEIFEYYNIQNINVVIGKDITKITDETWIDVNGETVATITFEEGSKIEYLGTTVCAYSLIEAIELPDSLKFIGGFQFSDCEKLTSITIPSGAAKIGQSLFYHCTSLKEAVIDAPITTVPCETFRYCTALTSVKVPASVEIIDSYAFANCSSLTSVFSICSNVLNINSHAFSNCNSIEQLIISDCCKKIGAYAFEGCDNLKSVIFPDDISDLNLGGYVFKDCTALTDVTLPTTGEISADVFVDTPYYETYTQNDTNTDTDTETNTPVDNTVLNDDVFVIPYEFDNLSADYLAGVSASHIIIEEGISSIDAKAFANKPNLKSIVIPSSVTTIGDNAFINCIYLESVTFSEGLTTIESFAFDNCDALTQIELPQSVTSIGTGAFYDCDKLKTVKLPSGITAINSGVFKYCNALETINLNNVTKYFDEAFYGCSALNAQIPSNTSSIGQKAFGYTGIKSIELTQSSGLTISSYAFTASKVESIVIDNVTTAGNNIFEYTKNLNTAVWNGPANIPHYAFSSSGIKQITVGDIGAISYNAFFCASSLETVKLGKISDSIGQCAFKYCSALKSFEIDPDSTLTHIGGECFYGCTSLEAIALPHSMATISGSAFYDCTSLKDVALPRRITTIGPDAFRNCPIERIDIFSPTVNMSSCKIGYYAGWDEANPDTLAYNPNTTVRSLINSSAAEYAKTNGLLFEYIYDDECSQYEVLDNYCGTTSAGSWKVLDFGDDVALIFFGKGDIDSNILTFNDGRQATAAEIFEQLNIKTVVFAEGITGIADNLLNNKDGSISATITLDLPTTLKKVGDYAFYQVPLKQRLVFSNKLESIGDYAFYGCGITGSYQFCDKLSYVGDYAFYNTAITKVVLPVSLSELGVGAFNNCTQLTSITVPRHTKLIYDTSATSRSAFPFGYNGDFKNTELVISTYMGSPAAEYAKKTGIKYSLIQPEDNSHGYIGALSSTAKWEYDLSKKTLYVDSSYDITSDKFYYADATEVSAKDFDVENVVICYGVTGFGATGLEGSPFRMFNPQTLYVASSVSKMSTNALYGLKDLKLLTVNSNISNLTGNAIKYCTSLEGVVFAGTAEYTVNASMFMNFKALKFADFGTALSAIKPYAFKNATALQQIIIPNSVKSVSVEAFYKCISVHHIQIGSGITSIGQRAFANLPYCEYVLIKGDSFATATGAKKGVFENIGSLTNGVCVEFDDGVTVANLEAFGDEYVTSVILGKDVAQLCNLACLPYLENIEISADNSNFYTVDDCIYNSQNQLVYVPAQKESVTIANGTTAILDGAFKNSKVRTITLPDSVKSIGANAFENCRSLKKINLSSSVTTIGDYAFYGCTALKIIDLPASVEVIGNHAFEGCGALASVIMGDNVETIGDFAFANCTALIGIVISENCQSIGTGAFENCISMEDICIWMNTSLGENVFDNCTELTIHTLAASNAYVYAREHGITYSAYTDADIFYDLCAMKLDVYAGYVGFCTDGHGEIQYLTVYQADCINDGYVIGVCEYCSEIIDQKHITATGHDYKVNVSIDATQTTAGMTVYACKNCNDQYADYTDPTGDNIIITTQTINGKIVIADDASAKSGTSPAKNVSVVIDGITVATTDENGTFTAQLESGLYQATLRYAFGFERVIYITVGNSDIDCGEIAIIGCDWNKDGVVDTTDNNLLKMVMSSQVDDPSYMEYADMNNDGVINVKDWVIVKNCTGINASTYTYDTIIVE